MLLAITTTYQPATDLGYLLHKHPDRLQAFSLSTGQAQVFYPEAHEQRCTACLMLDLNPVELVRNRKGPSPTLQEHYVNDRPYSCNSFLTTAISKAFGTALNGTCAARPDLVHQPLPLEANLASVKIDGEMSLLQELFGPLGYEIAYTPIALDPRFPSWGMSKYVNLRLTHQIPLAALLRHLYILLPVLDNDRHFWISQQDIAVLLEKGQNWLQDHPQREFITRRYLKNIRKLSNEALLRLAGEEGLAPELPESPRHQALHLQLLQQVRELLRACGAQKVLDIGCGEGQLLRLLLQDGQFRQIAGMDVSFSALQRAKENLHLEDASPALRQRLTLFQGSVTYKDVRLKGYDALVLIEVIEHLDEERLPALEQVVFGFARPATVVIATLKAGFNRLSGAEDQQIFRQEGLRFEGRPLQFSSWCQHICAAYGYEVSRMPAGLEEKNAGAPYQVAAFTRKEA